MPELDLLVRGGTVVDGSGLPAYTADVGVRDGRVVAVGRLGDVAADQTIDADRQQLHVVEGGDLGCEVDEKACLPHDVTPESIETAPMNLLDRALGNDVAALPIIAAIDRDEDAAGTEASDRLLGVAWLSRHAEPQDIHWRANILDAEAAARTKCRVTAIGGDDKIGFDFDLVFR